MGNLTPIRFIVAFMLLSWRDTFAYKADVFVKLVGYPSRIVMAYFLWQTLFEHGIIRGINFKEVFTYYLLVFFLTQIFPFARMGRSIREEIYNGNLSTYLARGYPHAGIWLARFFTTSVSYLLLILPVAVPLILLFGSIKANLLTFLASVILMLIGTLIRGQLWYLIGISSFFTEENMGTIRLFDLSERLLAGAILPLFLFPEWVISLTHALPFAYTLYAPIDFLVRDQPTTQAWMAVCIATGWSIALALLTRMVFHAGWKRFTAHGT